MVQAIERKSKTQRIVAVVKSPSKANTQEQCKYQATCFIAGRLRFEDGKVLALESLHGSIPVSGLHRQLRLWLLKHPDCDSGLWALYPRTDTEGQIRSVFIASRRSEIPENHVAVKVSGQIVWIDSSGKLVFRIHRNSKPQKGMENHPSWKSFLITVVGHLPDCKPGQFWQVECDIEDGCIVLVDGQKMRDATCKPKSNTASKPKLKPKKESENGREMVGVG